jgi:putative ABC transport system permease protein
VRWPPRRTPVALRLLLHDRVRLVSSALAIAFSVLIMFMEIGFLNGLYDSQTGLLHELDADLVLRSRGLHILNTHDVFARERLAQILADPSVVSAAPLYIEDRGSLLRNPATGARNVTRVIGFDPDDRVFAGAAFGSEVGKLREQYVVLYDSASRPLFGPITQGSTLELGPRRVTVGGLFTLGPDYYYDGNVLTSTDTLVGLFPDHSREQVSLGVIRLLPGSNREATRERIAARLGEDVELMTKPQIVAAETGKWREATPAGTVFTIGTVVGFVIGVFTCYQILFTAIVDRLPQFATLKAIGYRDSQIARLVSEQALLLGLAGFLPALFATSLLYATLTELTGIVTKLTIARALLVFVLALGMCLLAGRLAVRKALAIDPAELF